MARGHGDGRHDLRRRHAARRRGARRHQGRRGQLALVELRDERHADRLLLRPALAPRRRHDGRRAGRGALRRAARRLPARLPRALPRDPDQPHHPRLGDQGDDQDPHDLARPPRRDDRRHDGQRRGRRRRHLLRHHRRLRGGRGHVGRALDRPRPVRHQDERGHRARRVRGARGRRHRRHEDQAGPALRQRDGGAVRPAGERDGHRPPRLRLDAAPHAGRLPLGPVVGGVVSGRRAGRRRLRRPAHLQRAHREGRRARHALLPGRALRAPALAVDRHRPRHGHPLPDASRSGKPGTSRRSWISCRRPGAAS